MKIVIIIQARMGSSRLPGKMMKDLAGKPVVAHVVERALLSKRASEVWLATTVDPADDVLAAWATECQVRHYRGSVDDVLDRYYQTAKQAGADVVVRVTGDCPLADYHVIDAVIDTHLQANGAYDYVSNTNPPTYPDGLDVEAFSFAALERAWKEAALSSEREHVTPYIWKNPEKFRLFNLTHEPNLSRQRWTLDTPEDLAFLRQIVEACGQEETFCDLEDILEIIEAHPEWQQINAGHVRNEGYQKSVEQDAK